MEVEEATANGADLGHENGDATDTSKAVEESNNHTPLQGENK